MLKHSLSVNLLLLVQQTIGNFIQFTELVYLIKKAEPEPADLQWSGQKIRLDFNLLMCYDITSLSILYNLACMGIHSYIIIYS